MTLEEALRELEEARAQRDTANAKLDSMRIYYAEEKKLLEQSLAFATTGRDAWRRRTESAMILVGRLEAELALVRRNIGIKP